MKCPYVMRMCNKCGKIQFLFKFCKHKNSKYGFKRKCKECEKEYKKQYRKVHKKEISEYHKQWYKKYNNKGVS